MARITRTIDDQLLQRALHAAGVIAGRVGTRSVEPVSVTDQGETSVFELETRKPFLYFKVCLEAEDASVRWSVGPNMLVLMTGETSRDVYPYFEGATGGAFSSLIERDAAILGRQHLLPVYLPPGYH